MIPHILVIHRANCLFSAGATRMMMTFRVRSQGIDRTATEERFLATRQSN
jgi:hypothetical protein